MANGDSVKSWTSSNKKIVTVDKNGVIKAGKKKGTAKVTVTLQSGKKATLKVKVQTARVNTTKISGLKKNVSLKKGQKLTLKPAISPLTSGQSNLHFFQQKSGNREQEGGHHSEEERNCKDHREIRKEILCDQSKSKIKSAI